MCPSGSVCSSLRARSGPYCLLHTKQRQACCPEFSALRDASRGRGREPLVVSAVCLCVCVCSDRRMWDAVRVAISCRALLVHVLIYSSLCNTSVGSALDRRWICVVGCMIVHVVSWLFSSTAAPLPPPRLYDDNIRCAQCITTVQLAAHTTTECSSQHT